MIAIRLLIRSGAIILFFYLMIVCTFFVVACFYVGARNALYVTDYYLVSGAVKMWVQPAVTDDELLELFEQNISDFEKLIAIQVDRCITERSEALRPEASVLVQEIGLLTAYPVKTTLWLPDPYSDSALVQRKTQTAALQRKLSSVDGDLPTVQRREAVVEILERYRLERCKYQSIRFSFQRVPGAEMLMKGIEYFPFPPSLTEDRLFFPRRTYPPGDSPSFKLAEDLAFKWALISPSSCVYKKITPQWFLFVCPN